MRELRLSSLPCKNFRKRRFTQGLDGGSSFACQAYDFVVPAGSQVERRWNSRIEDCCARALGDDPYPEIKDVHSSRIEDCDPRSLLRCIVDDYTETNLARMKLGLEENQARTSDIFSTLC